MGRKGRGKERKVQNRQRRVTFVKMKVTGKKCKHRQKWLKKKGQVVEANVAMSDVDTKVLIASYVEDNTSQDKE